MQHRASAVPPLPRAVRESCARGAAARARAVSARMLLATAVSGWFGSPPSGVLAPTAPTRAARSRAAVLAGCCSAACSIRLWQLPLGDAEDEDAATALAAAALSNTFNHYEKCTPLGANIQGSSCLPPAGRPSVW